MGATLVGNNFLQIPLKILFHMKRKKEFCGCPKFTNHQNLVDSQNEPDSGQAACPCTNELYSINKALTKFNEALTKSYHGLIEILL